MGSLAGPSRDEEASTPDVGHRNPLFGGAVDFVAPRLSHRRPSREGGSHEVHVANPPGRFPDAAVAGGVGDTFGGRAEGRVRRLPGDQPDPGHPRPRPRLAGDGDHRAGAGRQDADHRRPVRRDQRRSPRRRVPRRAWRSSTASPWRTTATCTRHGASCCGASVERTRPAMRTFERWRWPMTKPSGACSSGDWQNSARLPVPLGNDGSGPGMVVTARSNTEVVRTWVGFRRGGRPVRRSPRRR